MASPIEIVNVSSNYNGGYLPVSNDATITTTAFGSLRRTDYMAIAAASTFILSTGAYLERMVVVPVSTGATTVTLSDGATAIVSIPAAAHAVSAAPYSVPLGITNTSTAGFKVVTGTSVSCIFVGGFVGAKTSA